VEYDKKHIAWNRMKKSKAFKRKSPIASKIAMDILNYAISIVFHGKYPYGIILLVLHGIIFLKKKLIKT
jgi:hypothetical protein